MQTTSLNPTQVYLLRLFSFSGKEETKQELQEMLSRYYLEKVNRQADELWDRLGLDQQKLEEMCSVHERLPYGR